MSRSIHHWVEKRGPAAWEPADIAVYCGNDGNNCLQAILSGIALGPDLEPVAPTRGIPADASEPVREDADGGRFGWGHSWLTVRELMAFPWADHRLVERWVMDGEDYRRLRAGGPVRPRSGARWWNLASFLPRMIPEVRDALIRPEEMDERLRQGEPVERWWTVAEYGILYADLADPFVTDSIPRLREVGPPEDVRLVFWFDG